ncbi:shikimate dehydrogenase [Leifsonia flava]|uniref:Shikimate dehydrogenase n=1 Tax=Orlajensenia leifsoniae TaxID=2561933 RepID=A0A4Y9R4V4_9MICO|nr:shikimate dehydrogenase [Leifsonia flava]
MPPSPSGWRGWTSTRSTVADAVVPVGDRLAVLGSPIAHSKSPALHAAAYAALGLDWSYERHEVDADGLEAFLGGSGGAWRGFSLTMPLKARALSRADELDMIAEQTGAVNTLVFGADGRSTGFNTDVAGLVAAIAEAGVHSARHVVILGAGATASSAIVAAADLGAEHVHLAVRNPARGHELDGLSASLGLTHAVSTFDELDDVAGELVISTLPGGTVLETGIPLALQRDALLFDVAYDPWPSALAMSWLKRGGRVASGTGMLLHQALVQVRIFVSGDPLVPLPDEAAVLAAMRAAIS